MYVYVNKELELERPGVMVAFVSSQWRSYVYANTDLGTYSVIFLI